MTGANLLCAELEDANLHGVSLVGVCLVGTAFAELTPLPQKIQIPLKLAEMEHIKTEE